MSGDYIFTCKECGVHDIRVVWKYWQTYNCTEQLECFDDCENRQEFAAIKKSQRIVSLCGWGMLDEDHHYNSEEEEIIESNYEGENFEILCEDCYENSDPRRWHFHEKLNNDGYDYKFYVHCGGCDREIEFGWSHPDRGGRIWPVECTDFNPWKCWPEPRYRERWAKKNWLKPDR